MRLLLGALFATLLAGCPVTPPEPPHVEVGDGGSYPPGPMDPVDAEDPPPESANYPVCARACANLKRLGCPEAERPDGGRTCYAVCADAEKSGKFPLKPICIATAKDVVDVKSCKTVRCLGK